MEPFREDDELGVELRALRPTPRLAFAGELDERAAAGFPRRSPLGDARLADLADWLRALSPRNLLLSGGATTLAALAIATAIVAGTGSDGSQLSTQGRHSTQRLESHAIQALEGHAETGYAKGLLKQTPTPQSLSAASAAEALSPEAEASAPAPAPGDAVGAATAHRDVERAAQVVLAADPADVGEDASRVFEAVHSFDGIVMRSSTREGHAGQAGASFDLLIPSAKLADALAAFSEIDQVRSRHEATADITAPTVSVAGHLRDSRARIDGLLAQLAAAESESEQQLIEAELGAERRRATLLGARIAHLHRRTSLSRVSLRIETGGPRTAVGGGWGIGDALHDAGHILTVAAAILLVSLAVLGPIALIALLAFLTQRAWLRRRRERTLG